MREVLTAQQVWTCPVVVAELLVRARDEAACLTPCWSASLDPQEVPPSTQRSGRRRPGLVTGCGVRGCRLPLPDLLIAQAAISRNLVLWHADEDFERIRQVAPLAARSFLQP